MSTRKLTHFFKNHATKALGEKRSSQLVFKDLRDSYNEAILDSNVNEEIKDTLMGHLRKGAKASYSLSIASVVRIYQEEIYPKLAVNGWRLKQKASEVDELRNTVSKLQNAMSQLESENNAYRTRIDNLQNDISHLDANLTFLFTKFGLNIPFDVIPTEEEIKELANKKRSQK